MTPHGPDAATFDKASVAKLEPIKIKDTDFAFMFETSHILKPTKWAIEKDLEGRINY